MFKQKISIVINSEIERDKIYNEFEILLGNYCKTGQIQSNYETPFIANNELISYQITVEKDSLSPKHNDEYVNNRIKNLEDWCNSRLKTEIIGIAVPYIKDVCSCKKSDFFILFTHAFNETSPIDCGTCNGIIPIYKIELDYDDKVKLLSWESNYKACDELQLGCTVGEKWATRQMSDPNSALSIQGIETCNSIHGKTGIPTYYYLHNYRQISHKQDKKRKCVLCDGEWLLEKQLHNLYNYKCDKCKLISSFTSNKG